MHVISPRELATIQVSRSVNVVKLFTLHRDLVFYALKRHVNRLDSGSKTKIKRLRNRASGGEYLFSKGVYDIAVRRRQ